MPPQGPIKAVHSEANIRQPAILRQSNQQLPQNTKVISSRPHSAYMFANKKTRKQFSMPYNRPTYNSSIRLREASPTNFRIRANSASQHDFFGQEANINVTYPTPIAIGQDITTALQLREDSEAASAERVGGKLTPLSKEGSPLNKRFGETSPGTTLRAIAEAQAEEPRTQRAGATMNYQKAGMSSTANSFNLQRYQASIRGKEEPRRRPKAKDRSPST